MKKRSASRKHTLALILLILVGFLLYANSASNELVWDDIDIIQESDLDLDRIPLFFSLDFWRGQNIYRGLFRPLLLTSLSLDRFFWHGEIVGYRLTNTLLHILNGVLLYTLIYSLFHRVGPAFLGSVFFIAHPINTEAVLWVKNRAELGSTTFLLTSLLLFARAWESKGKAFSLLYGLSLISMIIALLFKETALVLPLLLIIWCFFFAHREKKRNSYLSILPYFILTGLFAALKVFLLPKLIPPEPWYPEPSVYSRILTIPVTLTTYLRILIFPVPLCADRPFVFPRSLFEVGTLLSLALFLFVITVLVILSRKRSRSAFALLWILVALLPAANIFLLISRPIAEQRAYLASVGLCILVALFANDRRLTKLSLFLLCLLLACFSMSVIRRNRDWRDSLTLWEKTVRQSPLSSRGRTNIGNAYAQKGWYDRAIEQHLMAIRIKPYDPLIHLNLGSSYLGKEAFTAAISEFQQALALDPAYFQAHHNLGVLYEKTGKRQKAIEHFQKALEINPALFKTRSNLGVLYDKDGLYVEAERELKRALERSPNNCQIRNNLSVTYKNLGRFSEAMKELEKAEACDPNFPGTHLNRGAVLSAKGEDAKAIAEYREALKRDPSSREASLNLGQAYARQGMFSKARSEFTIILAEDPGNVQARYVRALCHAALNQFDEARKEIHEVLRLDPTHDEARRILSLLEKGKEIEELGGRGLEVELSPMAMGWMHEERGDYQKALELYGEEIRLHPLSPDGHNARGRIYYKLEQMEQAEIQFQTALKKSPRNADAYSNLGIVYGSRGEYKLALEELKRAIKLRPGLAEAHDSLGLIYVRMGKLKEAESELKRAIEEDPTLANAHNNLGMVYAKRGLLEKAEKEWEKALGIDPGHRGARRNLRKLGEDKESRTR